MPVTISRAHRDALYAEVVDVLAAIDDIQLELENGEGEEARRLWRRFDAVLRLLDQLGWDPVQPRDQVAIDLPPELLVRALGQLEERAEHGVREHLARPNDSLEIAQQAIHVIAACRGAIEQLADQRAWGERS